MNLNHTPIDSECLFGSCVAIVVVGIGTNLQRKRASIYCSKSLGIICAPLVVCTTLDTIFKRDLSTLNASRSTRLASVVRITIILFFYIVGRNRNASSCGKLLDSQRTNNRNGVVTRRVRPIALNNVPRVTISNLSIGTRILTGNRGASECQSLTCCKILSLSTINSECLVLTVVINCLRILNCDGTLGNR